MRGRGRERGEWAGLRELGWFLSLSFSFFFSTLKTIQTNLFEFK
jgi:hypothetical protein